MYSDNASAQTDAGASMADTGLHCVPNPIHKRFTKVSSLLADACAVGLAAATAQGDERFEERYTALECPKPVCNE